MIDESIVIAKCLGIAKDNFLLVPYQKASLSDFYGKAGYESRASEISHYCTIDTLKAILEHNCLRFTDVRFLNDTTEFMGACDLLEKTIKGKNIHWNFRNLFWTVKIGRI